MPRIKTLAVQLTYAHAVEDAEGNLMPIQMQPIAIRQPSEAAFVAAWREFEMRRRQMEEQAAQGEAEAFGGLSVPVDGKGEGSAMIPVEVGAEE